MLFITCEAAGGSQVLTRFKTVGGKSAGDRLAAARFRAVPGAVRLEEAAKDGRFRSGET
jgi:hypothetical protein